MNAYERENLENPKEKSILISPLSIQEIVYELVVNQLLRNDPQESGFEFEDKFSLDPAKSQIYVDVANHYDAARAEKRPAIIIFREPVRTFRPTLGQIINVDAKESRVETLAIHTMTCGIACIAHPVGYTESLAEYLRRYLIAYEGIIRDDFKLRRFRLVNVSSPQKFLESQSNFIVVLTIEIVFDEGTVVQGDDLKIKVQTSLNVQ